MIYQKNIIKNESFYISIIKRHYISIIFIRFYYFFSGEIISRHITLTKAEFESIVAEWFRFAKQRRQRNKNKENIPDEPEKPEEDNV